MTRLRIKQIGMEKLFRQLECIYLHWKILNLIIFSIFAMKYLARRMYYIIQSKLSDIISYCVKKISKRFWTFFLRNSRKFMQKV